MSRFPFVRLGDVCRQDRQTVKPGDASDLRYIGLESIVANIGEFNWTELSKTPESPAANSFRFDARHVLYGKLRPYLNKVAIADFEGKCSTEIIPLLPSERLDKQYLAYFLRSSQTVERISAKTAGARMPRADMDFMLSLEVPLPNVDEQRRIVDVLARAESIVHLRREAQKKAAELVPAIFHEMFGDPGLNPRGFRIMALSEVSEVISGVAKGRNLEPGESIEVPYMRVANVKDGYLDLSEVKTIAIKRSEMNKLRIEVGDLLMTEGGDPDKLGRAALWNGEVGDCVHQNHVFKVRSDRSQIVPNYLKALAGSPYGKAYFLSVAKKTTGIASINKTQLSAFPVVVPPMTDQERFSRLVGDAASIETQQEFATSKARATFHALLAQSFSRGA